MGILAAMASLSVSGNIGGHGASVSIDMDLGGSHHSHSDSEPRSPPQHPVRPTERAELEDEIKKEVEGQMDQMFAELKEDERLEDDTAMNEVQVQVQVQVRGQEASGSLHSAAGRLMGPGPGTQAIRLRFPFSISRRSWRQGG